MLGKKLIKAAAGAGGVEKDEYFNQTTLLLHGDGNQGANNFSNAGPPSYLAFSDNSSNDFPITVNGDAYGTPFSPYSLDDGYWSVNINASPNYGLIKAPNDAAFQIEADDFTLEAWVYPTVRNILSGVFSRRGYGSSTGWMVKIDNNGYLTLGGLINGSYALTWLASAATVPLNEWSHISISKESTTVRLFINGVLDANVGTLTTTSSIDSQASSVQFVVGNTDYNNASQGPFLGNISNARVIRGTALYTSSFTPSTSPLTTTSQGATASEVKLLTCQSNRIIDNSDNEFTLSTATTVATKVVVNTSNPFTTTLDGTTGSGYFDGTGDYLSFSHGNDFAFGTGDFTVELWAYANGSSTTHGLVASQSTGGTFWASLISGGTIYWQSVNGSVNLVSTSFAGYYNQWTHIAFVRSSGTTTIYLNGVAKASASDSTNYASNTGLIDIGRDLDNSASLTGWASNVRIVKGTALYTSAFTPPTTTLPNVTNTSLLTCQYQGTVRNVGFIDSSPNNFPITRNGNTTQGSFSPFSLADGEWSVYIGGVDDWVDIVNSGALLGSGAWTMECWFYATTTGVQRQLLDFRYPSGGQNLAVFLQTTNEIAYWNGTVQITGGTVAPNQWNHVLCSRDGSNDVRLFLNGVQIGSAYNDTTNYTTAVCRVGCANTGADFQGYISNVRLVNGSAVQTSGFTVPTSPLTDISGTTFLGLQSNRFVDNSATPVTSVTPNDAVSIQPFSPYLPSAAYSPSVNGGSGYFDGTGDNLQTPSNSALALGTGEFLLEFWYYSIDNTSPTYRNAFYASESAAAGGLCVFTDDTSIMYLRLYGTADYTWTPGPRYQWNHIVVTRSNSSSSNELSVYQNGVRVVNATQAFNVTQSQARIGSYFNGTYADMFGYISGLRVQKGAGYTGATYTVPTAPPTSDANTSLLLNFTNAGIYDSTAKNDLETVGNAQVDTSVVKYGTGSMEFDGTGDYLRSPYSPNFQMKTGDFTVEFWVYLVVANNYGLIFNIRNSTAQYSPLQVYIRGTRAVEFYSSTNGSTNSSLTSSTLISLSTWTHVAVVRSSGTVKIYIDGVADVNTLSLSGSLYEDTTWGNNIGGESGGNYLNGLIDDLRITKGVARYTSNFTVPDKAFPDQ